MKKTLIAGVLAMASSVVGAAPFAFQTQIGSSELDPSIWDGPAMTFPTGTPSGTRSSLEVLYASHDIDGAGEFPFAGSIEASGPTRISLFEVQRGSPEATAYRDYYERYPVGTDWARIARESHKERAGES